MLFHSCDLAFTTSEKSLVTHPVVSPHTLPLFGLLSYLCLSPRHKPGSANRPLQHHFPSEHLWQQSHHRGAGEESADAHCHQPLPAVAGRQRPDALSLLHAVHPHPQPDEGFRLWQCHLQGGYVLYG